MDFKALKATSHPCCVGCKESQKKADLGSSHKVNFLFPFSSTLPHENWLLTPKQHGFNNGFSKLLDIIMSSCWGLPRIMDMKEPYISRMKKLLEEFFVVISLLSLETACFNKRLWNVTNEFIVALHWVNEDGDVSWGRHPNGPNPVTTTFFTPKLWILFKLLIIWFTTNDECLETLHYLI